MRQDKYVHNEKFKSWTFTIMKNTFVDNYRRSSNQDRYRDPVNESLFVNQTEPAASDDPHSAYSAQEITQTIGKLKEKLREPMLMYINGYKYKEIADKLDLKIGTVKNRIFLSRKQLMDQLNG
jgi:RNA polymerase sigma-70 factor (ECF subfamily)